MKKISIIIPCYNAATYINSCILSLASQTIGIQNLELIFINDASTDNTYELLCEAESRYPDSILVIHCDTNGKQGTARNIGLQYVNSPYIGFMDIDDVLEPTMFEKLYNKATEHQCDLVICQSKTHKSDKTASTTMGPTQTSDQLLIIQTPEERFSFLKGKYNVAVWNKLYKKELITENNLYFPEGFFYEDIFFTELIKHYAKKIYILEEYLYHHLTWANSTSHSANNWKAKLDWIFVEEIKILELKKRELFDLYSDYYKNEFVISYITLIYSFITTYGNINKEILDFLQKRILLLFPDFASILIVNQISQNDIGYKKIILDSFFEEISDTYVEKLISSIQK